MNCDASSREARTLKEITEKELFLVKFDGLTFIKFKFGAKAPTGDGEVSV